MNERTDEVAVPVDLLDALARSSLANVYKPEGVEIWWNAHADLDPVERARKAYSMGEMIAT